MSVLATGIIDNYEDLDLIGSGAYGSVYRARSNSGQIVALKKVRVPLTEDGMSLVTIREIAQLRQLDSFEHPNIVRLLDVCHGRRIVEEQQIVVWLVFEHVDMDLANYMEKCPKPGLGSDRIKDLLFQILSGVDFLHSNRVVHRDLKPQNILVSAHGKVKLADFGLARIYDANVLLTPVVVTLWYRAPEVLLHLSYSSSVDIWSCGCIFAEFFRRRPLFSGQSEGDQLAEILRVIGTPPPCEWPKDVAISYNSIKTYAAIPFENLAPEISCTAKELLRCMLTFDPDQRITAKAAMQHRYFSEDDTFRL